MTNERVNTASRRTSSSGTHGSGGGRGAGSRKHNNDHGDTGWLIAGGVVIVILIIAIILVSGKKKGNKDQKGKETESASETAETEETLSDQIVNGNFVLDLSSLPGLSSDAKVIADGKSRAELYDEASKLYTWDLKIVNGDAQVGNVVKPTVDINATTEAATMGDAENPDSAVENTEGVAALTEITVSETINIPDLISPKIKEAVEQIFAEDAASSDKKKKEKKAAEESETSSEENTSKVIKVQAPDAADAAEQAARDAQDMWYVPAKGAGIGSFDKSTETFLMEGASDGCNVDTDKLKKDVEDAVSKGDYEKKIKVSLETIPASSAIKSGDYQIIASYTTKTTNNAVRNKNVRLACEAVNGTIVRPGEEFSYNSTVGERTEAKGYGPAGAYLNGEVVQEIGGGVCQVSSTLYNAVLKAGLKTTKRTSHTFKPTYVTPGMDATVSWGGPDYRFANLPSQPDISYDQSFPIGILAHYSDNTCTVKIYGRPVLKPGYELSLESEQTGEKEVVRVLIPPEDTEKEPTTGDKGSSWQTFLIIKKDGAVQSRNVDHNTFYTGHTEYYRETEATSETESEGESESYTGPVGPGMPSEAYETMQNTGAQGPGAGPGENNHAGPGGETETTAHTENNGPGQGPGNSDGPGGGNENTSGGNSPGEGPGVAGGGSPADAPMIEDGP